MTDLDAVEASDKLTPNILLLRIWPDEILSKECEDVDTFDEALEQFALDLFATMKHNRGIGLAAPQVGVLSNVFALWIEEDKPMFFVNPKIVEASDEEFEWEEGCLSVPNYFEKRKRPNRIVVSYKDVRGEDHEVELHGLYAFAFQHELDHLRGKVFVDELSSFKTNRIKTKIQKFLRRIT